MKILEILARIIKIMETLEINQRKTKINKQNNRNPYGNFENRRTPCENYKIHEIHRNQM